MRTFKRITCFLAMLLLLTFLVGCSPKLSGSATVQLTVETDATDYTVTSTYGEITGEDGSYTVHILPIREFMITVSAEGYETVNVLVTREELLAGNVRKTAVLSTQKLHTVTLTVNGANTRASASCDGIPLSRSGNTLVGEFTKEQLRGGIVVTAEGAATRTVTFEEEEFEKTFLTKSAYLIPADKKLVEIRMTSYDYPSYLFAVDDDGYLLNMETTNQYVMLVQVPKGYHGLVHIRSRDRWILGSGSVDSFVFPVAPGEETYSKENVFTREEANKEKPVFDIDFAFYSDCIKLVGYDSNLLSPLWIETDKILARALDVPDLYLSYVSGSQYHVKATSAQKFNITKIYVGDPFEPHVELVIPKNGGEINSANNSATLCEPLPFDVHGTVRDNLTEETYTDTVYFESYSSTDDPIKIVSENGEPIDYIWLEDSFNGNGALYILTDKGRIYLLTEKRYSYEKVDGKLYIVLHFYGAYLFNYRIVLTEHGKPVTGAAVHPSSHDYPFVLPFEEIAPGVYEGTQEIIVAFTVIMPDGEQRDVSVRAANWVRNGRVMTLDYSFDKPVGYVISLISPGVATLDFAVTESSTANQVALLDSKYVYILATYGSVAEFEIEYVLREGTRSRRKVTLDITELYSSLAEWRAQDIYSINLLIFPEI